MARPGMAIAVVASSGIYHSPLHPRWRAFNRFQDTNDLCARTKRMSGADRPGLLNSADEQAGVSTQ